MVRLRVRIRFSKQGDLRLIGHRDLMRCLERVFRRAGLTLSFSQGFHPKARMTFPLALAVGIEGVDEVMEVELAESYTAEELLAAFAAAMPAGARHSLDRRSSPGGQEGASAKRRLRGPHPARETDGVGPADRASAGRLIVADRACARAPADRPAPARASLALDEGVLQMRLRVDRQGSVGPRDVLAALGLAGLEQQGVRLRRTAVEVCA